MPVPRTATRGRWPVVGWDAMSAPTKIEELLDGLNPQQRAAVVHAGSPLLIVAGAGSGKTRVLTHRIAYLLAEREVRPSEVLAITFTNKAAGEMKERVAALVGARARAMWVSTFHSMCVRILRAEASTLGLKSSFSIYDADDSLRLMTLVSRELDLDPKRYPPRALAAQVSNLKNELVTPDAWIEKASNAHEKVLGEAYQRYQRRLGESHALDFDDLIMSTVLLLQGYPSVAEKYRRRFRHVLVDEYQDTNHAQYMLVRELTTAPVGSERCWSMHLRPPSLRSSATPTSRSMRSAARRSATSSSSNGTTPTPRRSCSSRTTARPRTSSPPRTRSSRATPTASRRTCGRRPARARRSSATSPRTSTTRRPGSRSRSLQLTDDGGAALVRHGGFLPDERAVPGVRGSVHPGRPALQGGRRGAVLRAARGPRRAGLPAAIANPADVVSLRRILNTPRRGIGDRAEAAIEALRRARRDLVRRRARPRARSARAGVAVAERDRRLPDPDDRRCAAVAVERAARPRSSRRCSTRPATCASSRPARTRRTRAGSTTCRNWSTSPASSKRPRADLDEPDAAGADRVPRAGRAGRRRRLDPRRRRRHGHADDPAHRQGAGVPGRVPDRHGGGVFPHSRALSDPAELAEERRLAYVGITRARERLYLSRALSRSAWGAPVVESAVPVPRRDPGRAHHLDRRGRAGAVHRPLRRRRPRVASTATTVTGPDRAAGPAVRSAQESLAASRLAGAAACGAASATGPIIALAVGDRVTHDAWGLGTRGRHPRQRRPGAGPDRLRQRRRQVAGAALRQTRQALVTRPSVDVSYRMPTSGPQSGRLIGKAAAAQDLPGPKGLQAADGPV